MADMNAPLTIADQVFVNAMAYIASGGSLEASRAQLALAKVRETLPIVSRGHMFLERIAEQADRMMAISAIKDMRERRETYSSARYRASVALQDFFFWRMGLADAALGPGQTEKGKVHG